MKRLLLTLMAEIALPAAVNANEKVLSEMNDIEANKLRKKDLYPAICFYIF